jgi:hypothetical protein
MVDTWWGRLVKKQLRQESSWVFDGVLELSFIGEQGRRLFATAKGKDLQLLDV